jgi:alkaline phosphatase D
MKQILFLLNMILLLLAGGFLFASCDNINHQEEFPSMTIGFGSCNRTDLPQVMWEPLVKNDPDVFIWLGDIVYGDTHNMNDLKSKYKMLSEEPGYRKLQETSEIIGVWDDHDYGWNDAGKNYPKRDSSKQILLDFLGVDKNADVRTREGIYTSYEYGKHPILTKVILLDTRYFRDTVISDPNPDRRYTSNETGDILGDAQWEWLTSELKSSTADIHIIGSGIQVIPQEHGWEKWGNFPSSRNRLFQLFRDIRPKNTLLITGDRHIAEYSKIKLDSDFILYEVTSSGLTHTWSQVWEEPNPYRIDDMIIRKNFGIINISSNKMKVEIRGELDSLFKSVEIPLL